VPIKIIAEIGSNWEGDIELGKTHIKKSKESGASFVKFQMWRAKDLYELSDPFWEDMKKSELTESAAKELKAYADKIGIKWFCSAFNPEAVDFLESLNVSAYKIASWTAALKHKFSFETIQKISKTNKPTFISTGFGLDKEKIESEFQKGCIEYTYCVPNYPAQDNEINWKELLKYNFFSDHTLGITIPIAYSLLKKTQMNTQNIIIEKHVKMTDSKGPDAPFSITYDELTDLVNHVNRIDALHLAGL
jgi:sialic acid synthase SpsE